jgi:glutathione S-transferase
MADPPILYSFRRCPYAMRARLALAASETDCILREVKLANKPAELVAASPKSTVPVLVLGTGEVLEESLDIMRWALERNDPQGWLHADQAETELLIETNDGAFKHHLDRYKYADRHGADPAEHRSAGLAILAGLEPRLAAQPELCGEHMSLADAALLPFVRQFAQVDRAWFDGQPLPNLRRWLERHLGSPIFDRISLRVRPWSEGDAPVRFPPILAEPRPSLPPCVTPGEEMRMTISVKPGNRPDPDDMAAGLSVDGEADGPAATHPTPAEEKAEEEAARLGDFA